MDFDEDFIYCRIIGSFITAICRYLSSNLIIVVYHSWLFRMQINKQTTTVQLRIHMKEKRKCTYFLPDFSLDLD